VGAGPPSLIYTWPLSHAIFTRPIPQQLSETCSGLIYLERGSTVTSGEAVLRVSTKVASSALGAATAF
jgi:hypothetical protein